MVGCGVAALVRGLGKGKEKFGHKSVGFVVLSGVCCPGTKLCGALCVPSPPAVSPHRCLHALKVGWRVCWAKAQEEDEQRHMAFLSHDISMLRLFETFLENTPQLTLLLYIILQTNKAELSQGEGLGPGEGAAGLGSEWPWVGQIREALQGLEDPARHL